MIPDYIVEQELRKGLAKRQEMRPAELFMRAEPRISRDGIAYVLLERPAFEALKADVLSMGGGPGVPMSDRDHLMWPTPRSSMRYNGTLFSYEAL